MIGLPRDLLAVVVVAGMIAAVLMWLIGVQWPVNGVAAFALGCWITVRWERSRRAPGG